MTLRRDSSNLLIVNGVVDYYDLDAGGAPTAVYGATVTAQIYELDRITPIGPPVTLIPEVGQAQNNYRGLLAADVDFGNNTSVVIRYQIDLGSLLAVSVSWIDDKVVDS